MDPNLTLAHVTHNTAVIQLHQCIAFPPPSLRQCALALPTASSAETCITAAKEIGTISQQFLQQSSGITHPQLAFCLFMAGRVLLASLAKGTADLHCSFDVVLAALSDMARRWIYQGEDQSTSRNLAARLANRLSEARKGSVAHGSTPTMSSTIDISRTVYDEDGALSRAASVRPQEEEPHGVESLQQSTSQNIGHEPSPSELSLDPFAFPFTNLPMDWEEATNNLDLGFGQKNFAQHNPTLTDSERFTAGGQPWDSIEEMFGHDFQQVSRRSGLDAHTNRS